MDKEFLIRKKLLIELSNINKFKCLPNYENNKVLRDFLIKSKVDVFSEKLKILQDEYIKTIGCVEELNSTYFNIEKNIDLILKNAILVPCDCIFIPFNNNFKFNDKIRNKSITNELLFYEGLYTRKLLEDYAKVNPILNRTDYYIFKTEHIPAKNVCGFYSVSFKGEGLTIDEVDNEIIKVYLQIIDLCKKNNFKSILLPLNPFYDYLIDKEFLYDVSYYFINVLYKDCLDIFEHIYFYEEDEKIINVFLENFKNEKE